MVLGVLSDNHPVLEQPLCSYWRVIQSCLPKSSALGVSGALVTAEKKGKQATSSVSDPPFDREQLAYSGAGHYIFVKFPTGNLSKVSGSHLQFQHWEIEAG